MNKKSGTAKDAAPIEYGEDRQQYRTIFWKREKSKGCVATWYGPRFIEEIGKDESLSVLEKAEAEQKAVGASRLYKWERRETKMKRSKLLGWGVCGDAWKLQHGEAARRKLQGNWNDVTKSMWNSVQHILIHLGDFKEFQQKLSDGTTCTSFGRAIYDFESTSVDGKIVYEILYKAIESGDTKDLKLLLKVIESVHEAFQIHGKSEWAVCSTLRYRVAQSVRAAAAYYNRVPTTEQVRQFFNDKRNPVELVEYPERDFREALQVAGFGWIIPSRKPRKAPKS